MRIGFCGTKNSDAEVSPGGQQWTNAVVYRSILESINIRVNERVPLVPDLHARDAKGIDVHGLGVFARVQLWGRVHSRSHRLSGVLCMVSVGPF